MATKKQVTDELIKVTKELTKVMGLKPELKTNVTVEQLKRQIKKAIPLIVLDEDEFTIETAQALEQYFNVTVQRSDQLTFETDNSLMRIKDIAEKTNSLKHNDTQNNGIPNYQPEGDNGYNKRKTTDFNEPTLKQEDEPEPEDKPRKLGEIKHTEIPYTKRRDLSDEDHNVLYPGWRR